ncbi:hypothetical protein V6C03_14105 [Methyloligella sp. 2.7D]|uniref:hypothetical protein n=1 Tax=unclassified Methyloligella TaxID=2625955 RepID=UPI00157CF03F|nr:hypothetical protein [Methyloligella sp. GL2]QKP77110.1 hypothetical protein HT051_06360 [Methyloligella sp. GL2]
MAVRLTPPKKNVFWFSVALGALALILYFVGIFGFIDGGFTAIHHYVFWIIVVGWAALIAGVAMKGV